MTCFDKGDDDVTIYKFKQVFKTWGTEELKKTVFASVC